MKQKLEVLTHLDTLLGLDNFYSVQDTPYDIKLQGNVCSHLVRTLKSFDFDVNYDKENVWLQTSSMVSKVKVTITLTF